MKHWIIQIGAVLLFVSALLNPTAQLLDVILYVFLCVYVLLLIFSSAIWQKLEQKKHWLVFPLIIIFVTTAWINSSQLRKTIAYEPEKETYRTDMDDFLKTYYLMEKGNNYYVSFATAVEQNAFKSHVSNNLWSWRLPTVFYLWKWLPGTNSYFIWCFFVLLASSTLWLSYEIGLLLFQKNNKRLALLMPFIIFPYFHFAVRDMTFLQTEWWGIPFIFAGIYFWLRKNNEASAISFFGAVIIRELFILPLLVLFIRNLLFDRKRWWVVALPIAGFILFELLHAQVVSQHIELVSGFLTPRLAGGMSLVRVTFAFASWEYMFYRFKLFLLLFGLGWFVIFITRHKRFLFIPFYFLPFMFLFLGTSIYNDYWGIFYMPFVLVSLPVLLERI